MKKYPVIYTVIPLFVLLIFSTQGLCFAGAADIKARMQERLPTIIQLKSEGIIGESNKGYLEYLPGAAKKMQDVVADENRDRETVYNAIAKQQGTTAELVGKRRALQIAEKNIITIPQSP